MKKLFLRDGKIYVGEFPEIPPVSLSPNQDAARMRSYNRSVESAVASAIEVVGIDPDTLILNGFIHEDEDFYLPPEGWTVDIGYQFKAHKESEFADCHVSVYQTYRDNEKPHRVRKIARLIPLKEPENLIASQIPYPESGIVGTGVPDPDTTLHGLDGMSFGKERYAEAAAQYASNRENLYNHIEINAIEAFKAGASFAEKDGWNAAIDKAIDLAYNSGLGDFVVEIGKLKI